MDPQTKRSYLGLALLLAYGFVCFAMGVWIG